VTKRLMKLKVIATGNPRETRVWVNDEAIPTLSVNLDFTPNAPPTVVLEFPVLEQDIESPRTTIALHQSTFRLLKRLGWHPPLTDDPRLTWRDSKEWQQLVLLILAAGGEITVKNEDIEETDFDDLHLEIVRDTVHNQVVYKIGHGDPSRQVVGTSMFGVPAEVTTVDTPAEPEVPPDHAWLVLGGESANATTEGLFLDEDDAKQWSTLGAMTVHRMPLIPKGGVPHDAFGKSTGPKE
jgi:hypothetical protein